MMSKDSTKKKFNHKEKERINENDTKESSTVKHNVVIFNQQIAVHAQRKELQKAKELLATIKEYNIANKHTYSTMMNAAIRCGQLQYAIELFAEMKTLKYPYYKDIVIYTTLMKGYCLQQYIEKAYKLYQEMIVSPVSLQPNIRTVNTIVRGCLQTGHFTIAEEIIQQYQKQFHQLIDINTWEYLLCLYSQHYSLDKIYPILGRIRKEYQKKKEEYTLIPIYMNLIKSLLLLQDWKSVNKWCQIISDLFHDYDRFMIKQEEREEDHEEADETKDNTPSIVLEGGKRGRKQSQGEGEGGGEVREDDYILARREESLTIYRTHLIEEWKYEISMIEEYVKKASSSTSNNKVLGYFPRVIPFDQEMVETFNNNQKGNETKEEDNEEEKEEKSESISRNIYFQYHLFHNLQEKFGLKHLLQYYATSSPSFPIRNIKDCNKWFDSLAEVEFASFLPLQSTKSDGNNKKKNKNKNKSKKSNPTPAPTNPSDLIPSLPPRIASPADDYMFPIIQSLKSYFPHSENTFLSLPAVFSQLQQQHSNSTDIKYNLEVCSGNGDWAVEQARNDPKNAWMTMELRSDRVYQTLYKAYLADVRDNLAMISGNALYILPNHLPDNSFHHIFINHPEPPQQTSSQQSSDADHLLNVKFFQELERILLPEKGMITVVTDNLWYGKLLVKILHDAMHSNHPLLSRLQPYQQSSTTANSNNKRKKNDVSASTAAWNVEYYEDDVILYEGEPGREAGHIVTNASSYFDRLWKRSELKKRYFIVLMKSLQPRSVLSNHKKQRIVIPPVTSTAAFDNDSKKRKHIVFAEEPESQEDHEEETGEARKKKVKFETPPHHKVNNSNKSNNNSNKDHQNKKKELRRDK